MTERIDQLLAEGKIGSAVTVLANNAGEISDKDFKNLNQKIKAAQKPRCKCSNFPTSSGRSISRGPKPGHGHR